METWTTIVHHLKARFGVVSEAADSVRFGAIKLQRVERVDGAKVVFLSQIRDLSLVSAVDVLGLNARLVGSALFRERHIVGLRRVVPLDAMAEPERVDALIREFQSEIDLVFQMLDELASRRDLGVIDMWAA